METLTYNSLFALCDKKGYEWWETPEEVHFMERGKIKERYDKKLIIGK